MATLLMTVSMFAASCSSSDSTFTEPQAEPEASVIHFRAQLGAKNGGSQNGAKAQRLVVTDKGDYLYTAWQENEKVALIYEVSGEKKIVEATVTELSGDAAIVEGDLTGSPANGTDVRLVYPYAAADKDQTGGVKANYLAENAQDGTLDGENGISKKFDVAVGNGKLAVSTGSTTASLQEMALLSNNYAILKLSFKDASTNAAVTGLNTLIVKNDNTGAVLAKVSGSALSNIYVAMEPVSTTTTVRFIAVNSSATYTNTASLSLLEASKFYSSTLAVQASDLSPIEELSIVDKQATARTKALFANLWTIADNGFMFGHHDDLWYGRYWYNEAGRSDTKEVCGDYPGVCSVDFGPIMDDRYQDGENAIRRRVILEAIERGEVITACAHLNNPLTGGDSWDNSRSDVVRSILTPGNATRTKFLTWLDRLADFCLNLKDSKGDLVPVIFRPFHEHTQSWSWWGSSCTTESEYINLWRMMVTYLRDTKGVHNLLYAVSPQLDSWYEDQEIRDRLLFRWPGDDYVDFLGMDCYHGENPAAFSKYLNIATEISLQKHKPCGVTEDGVESFTRENYWTYSVLDPAKDKRISMVVMWRNKYVGENEWDKHYYSVYPGHPSEENFRQMYNDSRTFFSNDLPDMYSLPENIIIK